MALEVDPAGVEIRALQRAIEWNNKRILEIGCGDGRLTLRLAAFKPHSIEAIDPDAARVRQARKNTAGRYAKRIRYRVRSASSLRYPPDEFDVVVFAWSL